MKIITYSDLHLEFGSDIKPVDGDILILAGDIITFKDFTPLERFLEGWHKPVLYVAGNHEYYTKKPMNQGETEFKEWLQRYPNINFLQNNAIKINGINFFGGTMWTDFNNSKEARDIAAVMMNDYRLIKNGTRKLTPLNTITFHNQFVKSLILWLETPTEGKRVVITHHCPGVNPNTKYKISSLSPAYNSLDIIPIIEKYQPDLWVYGHTHECDDRMIRKTRIISNQSGYPGHFGYECREFDTLGKPIEL